MRYTVCLVLCVCSAVVLLADDVVVTAKTFGCVLDMTKVRNTRIQNPDPEKLKEAIRIFRDSVPDEEYPTGTILQLTPGEAMVKHDRAAFSEYQGLGVFCVESHEERHRDPGPGRQCARYEAEEGLPRLPLARREIRFCLRKKAWVCTHPYPRPDHRPHAVFRPPL